MSFVEFLLEYYFYILAVLIVLIVGVIGFLVDSKNKNNKKKDVKDEVNPSGGQVVNNVDPLQGASINNDLNNGLANMQPIGGENLVQNQVQPQIQNNGMSVNSGVNASTGIVDDQNASIVSNNGILGTEPINTTNVEQGNLNTISSQPMNFGVQPNFNNEQVLGTQVMQPIDVNNGMNQIGVNNNLGVISDISVLQGMQPTMQNNNISNVSMPLGGNQMGMQNIQPGVTDVAINPMGVSNMQPSVTSVVVNPMPDLSSQSQVDGNVNQTLNNQVQLGSNDISNSVGAINGINTQLTMQNGIPLSSINGGVSQVNNQNFNVGNNMMGVPANIINNNVQSVPNSNMKNPMEQMNGQVYTANNSQPFDISSMFGNNQQ